LLRPQRTRAAQAFAGVTTEQGLFVLRTLATDHRLRVVFTATHAVPKAGVVRHDCEGPAAMLLHCTAGFRQGSWDAAMAASLQHYTAGPSIRARQLTPQGVERQRREVLVSWVIAPVGTGVQGA
jgi:hypothetical protein